MGSATTSVGLERVTVDRDGRGCRTVWHSDEVAPSAVPKLAAASGLVFTYAGVGLNNNFAPVTIGPDDAAYVGALVCITRFR